jgi:hypothetical protein
MQRHLKESLADERMNRRMDAMNHCQNSWIHCQRLALVWSEDCAESGQHVQHDQLSWEHHDIGSDLEWQVGEGR